MKDGKVFEIAAQFVPLMGQTLHVTFNLVCYLITSKHFRMEKKKSEIKSCSSLISDAFTMKLTLVSALCVMH